MYLVMSEISLETLLSSEYGLTVDEISDERSLTYKINKAGSRIVTWCPPDKTDGMLFIPMSFGDFGIFTCSILVCSMHKLA